MKLILRFIALKMSILRVDAAIIKRKKVKRNGYESIIIPCYNIENEIRFCINSLLNQRYKNLELIIIDDGSSDGTYKVCEELAVYDSRIKLIKQKNKGVSEARNKGLREASGNLICFVDSDDIVSED